MQNSSDINSKRILIFGANGQDGSYMLDYLQSLGHEVIGTCFSSSKHEQEPMFHHIDIKNHYHVDYIIKLHRPDYVINFAAITNPVDCQNDFLNTYETNTKGVFNIIHSINNHIPKSKFFNCGSSHQYSLNEAINEHSIQNPVDFYGLSKCSAYDFIKYFRNNGIFACQGILFNHTSILSKDHFAIKKICKGFARINKAIENGQPFEPIELGNLNSAKDWTHPSDVIKAIWAILEQDTPKDYVIGSGKLTTIKKICEIAASILGVDYYWAGSGLDEKMFISDYVQDINPIKSRIFVSVNKDFYRESPSNGKVADFSKIYMDLGWKPTISIDEIIKSMLMFELGNNSK